MGFKKTDVNVLSATGPTVLIPTSKSTDAKLFSVSRTDTTSTVKCVLAADSSIIGVKFFGSTDSDAGTTASVTITVSNNTGTVSTGSVDVKANGATTAEVQMTNLPNLEDVPAFMNGDLVISATYAETGTASTTGGPWFVLVEFVR